MVTDRERGRTVKKNTRLISHTIDTVEKTVDYTVVKTDSGKLLIANHAANQVSFTLPAVADGENCVFDFASVGAAGMKIISGAVNTMVAKNDAAADSCSYETTNEKIGAACRVIGDGTLYYFFEASGCTVTIA